MTPDESNERVWDYLQKAMAQFPLKLIETTGDQALAKWQKLKSAGHGSPVVLAADDEDFSLGALLDPFAPDAQPLQPLDDILKAAAGIRFPGDLVERRKDETAWLLERFKNDFAADAAMADEPEEPPLGEWPAQPEPSIGLSVARNILTGKPLAKVYIGIAPTDDWTTIPAYLRWGGWNDCPHAEEHVAALRNWRDRYGAELVGMSRDTINLRVAKMPQTREEALALARDQYIYCADIIDQGVQTYSALAAHLMANDWWYFWWD